MAITYTVNGQARCAADAPTVLALLRELGLLGRKVAVEKNGCIVPKSRHADERVADGDAVEIVTAVGGG